MQANQTLRHFTAHIRNIPFLTNKEKDVLVKRMTSNTLEKIGVGYDLTAERIRQIEQAAITKIKNKIHQIPLFD